MNDITICGNLTRDPQLKFSAAGEPRAMLTVAVNEPPRPGKEEITHYIDVTVFGTLAENVAASLARGQRVVAAGRLNTYKKEVEIDGETKNLTMVKMTANSLGPDLRFAIAKVTKVTRDKAEDNTSQEPAETPAPIAPAPRATAPTATEGSTPAHRPTRQPKAVVPEDDEF